MSSYEQIDASLLRFGKRSERVLLLAYFQKFTVPSIVETIATLQGSSEFPITVINFAEHISGSGNFEIPAALNISEFDVIVVHNTVAYDSANLWSLDRRQSQKLEEFDGLKVIMKQDEHFKFADFVRFVESKGIDLVFTVMPSSELDKTYTAMLPEIRTAPMLTGYITPAMRQKIDFSAHRDIDIGYRGSIMPLSFGQLCYQKRKIGIDVSRLLANSDLKLDISSDWNDRFSGERWKNFLQNCKSVLGVESGTGVFDLDGTLETTCRIIESALGEDDGSEEYANAYLNALSSIENRVRYYAISPRHFEAICAGAVQLLLPGNYSNRLIANRHYFELNPDYSNLDEALEIIRDDKSRISLAERAFEEVALNNGNWIETFVHEFDVAISEAINSKGVSRKSKIKTREPSINLLMMQGHAYGLDPRRDEWYAKGAPEHLKVHQLGISKTGSTFSTIKGKKREIIINAAPKPWDAAAIRKLVGPTGHSPEASFALRELFFIESALQLDDAALFNTYGLPHVEDESETFRWYLNYILDVSYTLVDTAIRLKGVHAILCINFPSVFAALILKGLLRVPVIYDALEYWPEMVPSNGAFASQFWKNTEARLLSYVDAQGTVSPTLAEVMSDSYGKNFFSTPNFPPYEKNAETHQPKEQKTVSFLYQGNFAPNRGLEQLLDAWRGTPERARLILRGPDSPHKQLLVDKLSDDPTLAKRISFIAPVSTDDLLAGVLNDGDVGLVPYPSIGKNYENCSPNKFGQYLAAGVPILANKTKFVAQVIAESGAGICVDFEDTKALVTAVRQLCDLDSRKAFSKKATKAHKERYNWSEQSRDLYGAINEVIGSAAPAHFEYIERKAVVDASTPLEMDDADETSEAQQNSSEIDVFEPNNGMSAESISSEPEDIVTASTTNESLAKKLLRPIWRLLPSAVRHRISAFVFRGG